MTKKKKNGDGGGGGKLEQGKIPNIPETELAKVAEGYVKEWESLSDQKARLDRAKVALIKEMKKLSKTKLEVKDSTNATLKISYSHSSSERLSVRRR